MLVVWFFFFSLAKPKQTKTMLDSNKVRSIRASKNLKQEHLAEEHLVSQSTYSKYENGSVQIPLKKLKLLAGILKVSIHELLITEE